MRGVVLASTLNISLRDRGRLVRAWCFLRHPNYHDLIYFKNKNRWICGICEAPFYKEDCEK